MTHDNPSQDPSIATPESSARRVQSVKGTKGDMTREARIKAALKVNISKRKAQARARDNDEATDD